MTTSSNIQYSPAKDGLNPTEPDLNISQCEAHERTTTTESSYPQKNNFPEGNFSNILGRTCLTP